MLFDNNFLGSFEIFEIGRMIAHILFLFIWKSFLLCRIAIKVLGFHDMTLPDNLPTGPVAMAIRHLSRQGYKVLSVSS